MRSVAALIALLLAFPAVAAEIPQVASFSHIPPGARAAALGGGLCAFDNGATCVFTNPAGLARMPYPAEASFDAAVLPFKQSLSFLGIAGWPTPEFALGVGAILYSAGDDIEVRKANTFEPDSLESAFSQAWSIAMGLSLLGPIDAGISLKFLLDSVGKTTAQGLSSDLGLLYRPYPPLTFGFMMQDAIGGTMDWSTETAEKLPVLLHFGAVFELSPVTLITQMRDTSDSSHRFSLGAEYEMHKAFFLRAGLDGSRLAGGLGVSTSVQKQTRVRADYSIAQSAIDASDLEHRIAVTINFIRPKWPMRKELLPTTQGQYY